MKIKKKKNYSQNGEKKCKESTVVKGCDAAAAKKNGNIGDEKALLNMNAQRRVEQKNQQWASNKKFFLKINKGKGGLSEQETLLNSKKRNAGTK